ncbi:hypothetical protein ACOIWI_004642 [Vibrio vulnificus]|nr:hypothetical protein [Vibrio vulnificus]EGR0395213.1 hypothetical protein [Vibrio vulnificus]
MESNIQKFDRIVALVLAELYRKFPVRSHVCVYTLFDCKENGYWNKGIWYEPEDLAKSDREFYVHTVKWLIDSGYVIGTIEHHNNSSITLSMKGLQLLKSVPDSLDSSESLGEQLLSVVNSGAKDSAAQLISRALSYDNLISQVSNFFSSAPQI